MHRLGQRRAASLANRAARASPLLRAEPHFCVQVRARLAVESPAMGTISAARFGSGHEVFLQLMVEQLPPKLRSLQLSRRTPSGKRRRCAVRQAFARHVRQALPLSVRQGCARHVRQALLLSVRQGCARHVGHGSTGAAAAAEGAQGLCTSHRPLHCPGYLAASDRGRVFRCQQPPRVPECQHLTNVGPRV